MGCDRRGSAAISTTGVFQSTHPHGVRHRASFGMRHRVAVSIHAPAWGATAVCSRRRLRSWVSIHAPAWGATMEGSFGRGFELMFQSTHPHGVRHITSAECRQPSRFQSTHPHGVRPESIWATDAELVFQSTHPHGVRQFF